MTISNTKWTHRNFDTINDILRCLSLVRSLLKVWTAPIWRIKNLGVKICITLLQMIYDLHSGSLSPWEILNVNFKPNEKFASDLVHPNWIDNQSFWVENQLLSDIRFDPTIQRGSSTNIFLFKADSPIKLDFGSPENSNIAIGTRVFYGISRLYRRSMCSIYFKT